MTTLPRAIRQALRDIGTVFLLNGHSQLGTIKSLHNREIVKRMGIAIRRPATAADQGPGLMGTHAAKGIVKLVASLQEPLWIYEQPLEHKG